MWTRILTVIHLDYDNTPSFSWYPIDKRHWKWSSKFKLNKGVRYIQRKTGKTPCLVFFFYQRLLLFFFSKALILQASSTCNVFKFYLKRKTIFIFDLLTTRLFSAHLNAAVSVLATRGSTQAGNGATQGFCVDVFSGVFTYRRNWNQNDLDTNPFFDFLGIVTDLSKLPQAKGAANDQQLKERQKQRGCWVIFFFFFVTVQTQSMLGAVSYENVFTVFFLRAKSKWEKKTKHRLAYF